jgi:hypothetical protein
MPRPTPLGAPLSAIAKATIVAAIVALLSGSQSLIQHGNPQWPSSLYLASAIKQANPTSEIVQHKQATGILGNLQPFAPIAGALVALLALMATTVQYLRDRRRERELRIEEGVAESTNKLTAFPGDPEAGIGTIVAALRNLQGFVSRSNDATRLEEQITDILVTVAREDLDYRNPRHARFDTLCFQYWKAYRHHQGANPTENLYILEHYIEALEDLERRTSLVTSVTFSPTGIRNIPRSANGKDIIHLTRLITGYGLRFALLSDDEAPDEEQRFFRVTGGNESLRDQILSSKKQLG